MGCYLGNKLHNLGEEVYAVLCEETSPEEIMTLAKYIIGTSLPSHLLAVLEPLLFNTLTSIVSVTDFIIQLYSTR
jgi:hypothetical protein